MAERGRSRRWLLCGLLPFLAGPAAAQDAGRPLPPGQAEAFAALAPEDRALLEERKVLVAGPCLRQVFEPYLMKDVPFFITSDSLLHGYHVLFDESFLRLEQARAARLPAVLRRIGAGLPAASRGITGNPGLLRAARERAAIPIAVALRLLGEEAPIPDAGPAGTVDAEVARVMAAREVVKPAWLGPPDPGFLALDYGRFEPRGFYADTLALARYFRAVAYLQAIPYRVGRDDELLAALLLGNTVAEGRIPPGERTELERFLRGYSALLGQGDDADLLEAARHAPGELEIRLDSPGGPLPKSLRDGVLRALRERGAPQVNDQVRFFPGDPDAAAEPEFRILAAHRLPDAVLFGRTTDPRRLNRPWPNTLEVAALLGSAEALEAVLSAEADAGRRESLRVAMDGAAPLFAGAEGLYGDYLRCLEALLDAPEPGGPRFLAGTAWRAKSLNAALSSWAQMRRTFLLQAKTVASYGAFLRLEPGYVEPDPEFFARLGGLAERTESLLAGSGAFQADARVASRLLRDAADQIEARRRAGKPVRGPMTEAEPLLLLQRAEGLLAELGVLRGGLLEDDPEPFLDAARKSAAAIDAGTTGRGEVVEVWARRLAGDVGPLWRDFVQTCRRLEALARKQLRGVPFDEEDRRFLVSYGKRLASYLLYGGNAYLRPRDDAPRVVDVFANLPRGEHLEVGVSRPRRLYVLYDFGPVEVLCVGAVLPYREMVSSGRLTDDEWRSRIDEGKVPPPPPWAAPFLGKDAGERAPEKE